MAGITSGVPNVATNEAETELLVNDITALRAPGALETAAASGAAVCLMHMQGEPATMLAR